MLAPLSGRSRLVQALRSVCPQPVLNWREAQYYGRYGEVELHFLDILCAPDRDSVDVGANDGCYVHFLRRHSRHVHAFEPIPRLAKALVHKFTHGVTIHPVALSNATGTATLHIPVDEGTPISGCSTISSYASSIYAANQEIPVPTQLLDDVCASDVGFIKIDVEGYEESVIEGGRKTIEKRRSLVLVEILERFSPGGLGRVAGYFSSIGYHGAFVFRRRLLPVNAFDPRVMQRDEDCPDLKATLDTRERFGPFTYNFIFVPEDRAESTFRRIENRIANLGP